MSIEEQSGEPVEVDTEITAELEMLQESAPELTDSHQTVRPFCTTVGFDGTDADNTADHGDGPAPDGGLKVGQVADALQSLRCELSDVHALTARLETELGNNESVINVLANDVESTRMRQTNTEELLGLCLSEIEKLKSQMTEARDDSAVSNNARAPGANGSMQAAPLTADTDRTQKPEDLTSAEIDELRVTAESAPAKRAPVLPISGADDVPGYCGAEDAPTAGNSMRALVVRNCSTTKSYPLDAGTVSLGSSPDNDIKLGSKYVSRRHAEFVNSRTECILKDLDSTNGTYVNSRRVKRYALRNGDWIAIGKHRFEFVEHDSMKRDS